MGRCPSLLDERADLDDLQRVQAHGGFVQNDDLRVAQQGLGDADALLISLGQRGDALVAHGRHARLLQDLADLPPELCAAQALGLAHELQVLHRVFVHVEGRLLRQVADPLLGLLGLLEDVESIDAHAALRGREAPGQDVHGGGLSGAVRPEEAVDLPASDAQAQVGDCGVFSVPLGQVLDFDQGNPLLLSSDREIVALRLKTKLKRRGKGSLVSPRSLFTVCFPVLG